MKLPALFKKSTFYAPTITGWILIGVNLTTILLIFLLNIHPYLAKSAPVGGELLVVEGWQPDYALKEAARIFSEGNYKLLVSTGGPLDQGSYLLQYKTYAHLARLCFHEMGIADSLTVAVPAESVRKDRTYQSAIALKKWLESSEISVKKLDLLSLGAHTRRSALVFEKVLKPQIKVGKISVENADYDSGKWWKSSEGVKTVYSELISLVYTFFFLSSKYPASP